MKKFLLTIAMGLALTTTGHAYTCKQVVKSLGLTKTSGSLGIAGALEITDKETNETVRVFVSQDGYFKNENQERYDFNISGLKVIKGGKGELFNTLNENTNFQVLEITHPAFPKDGCGLGFYGRVFDAKSERINKKIDSLGNKVVNLQAAGSNSSQVMGNEIEIKYYGINLD